jgi:hypothetical protein
MLQRLERTISVPIHYSRDVSDILPEKTRMLLKQGLWSIFLLNSRQSLTRSGIGTDHITVRGSTFLYACPDRLQCGVAGSSKWPYRFAKPNPNIQPEPTTLGYSQTRNTNIHKCAIIDVYLCLMTKLLISFEIRSIFFLPSGLLIPKTLSTKGVHSDFSSVVFMKLSNRKLVSFSNLFLDTSKIPVTLYNES